ncbi:acylphosphatase [Ruicaihuangia caeni]|uniref:acylphosphatase n=1 Tax=Ruicaihuangia caeni TaxID=3042517 RepID=UPI00338FE49D
MRRVHVLVRGDVQGVGYRFTMQSVARDSDVTGWVRNRRDGTVEAEVQGDSQHVDRVLEWMSEGPPAGHVESVTVTDVEPFDESGFRLVATV